MRTRTTMALCCIGFILLTLLSLPAFSQAAAEVPGRDPAVGSTEGYSPFAFAISGGVSLGSYEAGINWALINYHQYLRSGAPSGGYLPPKLMGVTGASAGGINALMTGISWCVDPQKVKGTEFQDTVDKNLFKEIWLGVGFDTLLPEQAQGGYKGDDGVLTRNAFKKVLEKLKARMDAPIFLDSCTVPVGLMVTRTEPLKLVVNGITVENERFVIPLLLTVGGDGRLHFKSNPVNTELSGLGNVIYLAGTGERDELGNAFISTGSILDAVLASSAFPVAFGRKELHYCYKEKYPDETSRFPGMDRLCPPHYRYDSADFVDGGVFDNIPLGAAKELAEPHQFDYLTRDAWEKAGRRFSYIYIDPDSRRSEASREDSIAPAASKPGEEDPTACHCDKEKDPDCDQRTDCEKVPDAACCKTFGLRSQLGFLSGAVTTGRTYELYKTLGNGDWSYQAPLVVVKSVIPVLDRAIVDRGGSIMGRGSEPVSEQRCDELYRRLAIGPPRPPSADDLSRGRICLRHEALSLYNSYLFRPPAGEPLRGDAEVATLRSDLIQHAHLLVRTVDRKVDLLVQRTGTDKLGDRSIILSSRFFPITGNYLACFGAFIDLPMREFDYYAGVYDAVNDLAEYACKTPASVSIRVDRTDRRKGTARCIAENAAAIYRNLGIHADSKADTVFHFLSDREKREYAAWDWLKQYPVAAKDRNLEAIGESLEKTEAAGVGKGKGNDKEKDSEFKIFITNLAASDFDSSASSADMKRILKLHRKDESSWYYALSSRTSRRLLELEGREAQAMGGGGLLKNGLSVGALALNTYVHEDRRLMGSPSSAPLHQWQNFLPYEVSFDVRNGGVAASWEPRLRLFDSSYLGLKTTPAGYNRFGEDWIWFSQADLYFMYSQQNNLWSAGAGPTVNATWERWPGHRRVNYGAALFVGGFNKLRLTFGYRSVERGGFGGDNLYIQLGITDIPGIAYWFTR